MSYIASNLRPFDITLDTVSTVDYTYTNLDDTLATIKGTGYLNKRLENTDNIATLLKVNDLVYITGSDGSEQLKVTAIDPTIVLNAGLILIDAFIGTATTSILQSFAAPNTIDTDTVIATIASAAVPLGLIAATSGSAIGFITVLFSGNPTLPTLVNLMSFRQA